LRERPKATLAVTVSPKRSPHACDKISALMKERSQIYNHVMALEKAVRNQAHAGDY
jgi:hypothetical protein